MISEHEMFFEKCEDPETRMHGLAMVRLVRNILNECHACPFRIHIEHPEPGLSLWHTMQKRIVQEAFNEWPEARECAYKLGLAYNQFKHYINAWQIKPKPRR